jgi:hypothetical protein
MVARYICQVTFQDASGLSKDRFENYFHFIGAGATPTSAESSLCIGRIGDFYSGTTIGTTRVGMFMASSISRTVSVKVYNEDSGTRGTGSKKAHTYVAGVPRPVMTSGTFQLPATGGAQDLPEEVALCLSYYSTSNAPRHRGRVYIGPLNTSVLTELVNPRPSDPVLQCWVDAGSRLALQTGASITTADHFDIEWFDPALGIIPPTFLPVEHATTTSTAAMPTWCVKSSGGTDASKTGVVVYEPVLHGWADNEWDVERRRRVEASARIAF